jgi:hypothetical protein
MRTSSQLSFGLGLKKNKLIAVRSPQPRETELAAGADFSRGRKSRTSVRRGRKGLKRKDKEN